jgi:hypothetical protein
MSFSATGTEIELSRLSRNSPGFGEDTLFTWLQVYRQKAKGPARLHQIRSRGRNPSWQTSTSRSTLESTIGINFYKQTHKGPKIVALSQGRDPLDEDSGKLIDVGILSGSLRGVISTRKSDIYEIPYSIFGLGGQFRFCAS